MESAWGLKLKQGPTIDNLRPEDSYGSDPKLVSSELYVKKTLI